ncbi:glycogen debranching N-terminal domain-containing protein [Cellulomonas marina]|uniref:Amylo-alpha-1,6-glucosidase n=1 Tax=Cellulomonas marina TaxID=988821 RepID=A0A1I0W2V5_9CELL|nr:glycogen debranching N-terminal domain-containing protein [Cellulomonas marina]SFA83059.1 Amylo-alpha-1,6-glucosidase [Cellulomonas marina]
MTTLQPLLHDLLAAVAAPTQAWSAPDGQLRAAGAQGIYQADTRLVRSALLTVGGAEPETVAAGPDGPGAVRVTALVRAVDGPGADPTTRLDRRRVAAPGRVQETLVLTCATAEPVTARVALTVRPDASPMEVVKTGRPPVAARLLADDATDGTPDAGDGPADGPGTRWEADGGRTAALLAPGAEVTTTQDADGPVVEVVWDVVVTPGTPTTLTWSVDVDDPGAVVGPPVRPAPEWSVPRVQADDRRLPALLAQSLDDLATLRMTAAHAPDDVFLAAGAPWFFTLFGRDSLWAARMLLPLGTELAAGTLRTLAALQGTRTDPATAEQPGKILHEVRAGELALPDEGMVLPPVYYGTVDATPLWVCVLHDAWRWGMPAEQVEALLPAAERALAWMSDHGDADGDGFLEYVDETGHGLANQGWKDSGDSVQWRDGTLATGPIALVEVQGYAHEAALAGAALLDAFGRPGGDRWRAWAARLAERFRASFWTSDDEGPYPGIALDADKRVVDSVTSNLGHLLGTGLLSAEEEAVVAARLAGADLGSGRGLRTLSARSGGFWPLRYHGGAVWPHDTAIAVAGLARAGHGDVAASLAAGLLAVGEDVGWRLPELWSGDAPDESPRTVPYPAACRPQAWSAASAVVVLSSALGLRPDVPGGTLTVAPVRPSPFGALGVEGLRLAGHPLDVRVTASGEARVTTSAAVQVRGADSIEAPRR